MEGDTQHETPVNALRRFAVDKARSLVPDAILDTQRVINQVRFTSATHGELACFYKDCAFADCKGSSPLGKLLLHYLGALILEHAHDLGITPYAPKDRAILDNEMAIVVITLASQVNQYESRFATQWDTLLVLMESNQTMQIKLAETLDALHVCEMRLNILQFGEQSDHDGDGVSETDEPAPKRVRTDEAQAPMDLRVQPAETLGQASPADTAWLIDLDTA